MYEIFVHEKKYVRREKVVHLADLDNKFAFVTFDSVPPEKIQSSRLQLTPIFNSEFFGEKLFKILKDLATRRIYLYGRGKKFSF